MDGVLGSPEPLSFNNLTNHEMVIKRNDGEASCLINGKYPSKQWILKKLTSEENILDQKVNGEAYAASSVACLPNALGERFLEKEISSVIG